MEPGVVDVDSEGQIFIIIHTPFPPITIPKGQRVAQLVPLPQMTTTIVPRSVEPRGSGCLGSSGTISLPVFDLTKRPRQTCLIKFEDQELYIDKALLDTGADTSIIDVKVYPTTWPQHPAFSTITGIGGMQLTNKTPPLIVKIEDKTAPVVFSLTSLPPQVNCLLGRDVLAQLGFVLTNSPF